MLVRNWMSKNPVVVTPGQTVADALALMEARGFRRVPVVENARLVGIFTDRDAKEHKGFEQQVPIRTAMTENPVTIAPNSTVEEAARIMLDRKIDGLPVVRGDDLVGIITTSDVLRAFREVTGASVGESYRIDFVGGDLMKAGEADGAIRRAGGDVLALGAYRDPWQERPVFYLRVRGVKSTRAAGALDHAGFTVLGVHP
jgi:acetoin utilization protein AcuB